MLLLIILGLFPFGKGISSPLVDNESNHLIITKSLQENDYIAFNSSVDEKIIQFMQEGHIPSLAASVVYNDSLMWSKGYGEQPSENVAFMIGSITKPIIATALLQLYEQGKLNLDDDVNNYLPFSLRNPNYPNTPITFRTLLLHQSSLLRGGEIYQSYIRNDLNRKEGFTNETLSSFPTWIDDVVFSDPQEEVWGTWAPGEKQERLAYSNFGFDILAYLVECISNQPIEEYLTSNIFIPLKMTNTHYSYESYPSDNVAIPHEWIPDEIDVEFPRDENDIYKMPIYDLDELGAGALRSTAMDLAHFLIAHMNNGVYQDNQILTEESINLMHNESQVYYSYQPYHNSYGFAWMNDQIFGLEIDGKHVNHLLQGHSGRVLGYSSLMLFNQDSEIGVILFVNQDFIFVPEFNNQWDIFELLYKEGLLCSISNSCNVSGFSTTSEISDFSTPSNPSGFPLFLSSLTIALYVIFTRFRNRRSSTE